MTVKEIWDSVEPHPDCVDLTKLKDNSFEVIYYEGNPYMFYKWHYDGCLLKHFGEKYRLTYIAEYCLCLLTTK